MSTLLQKIILQLKKDEEGISAYKLALTLGRSPSHIQYYLASLEEAKVVEKRGTKYFLMKTTFVINKSIFVYFPSENKYAFLECEYADECECKDTEREDCKATANLPNVLKQLVYEDERNK